jgi:hypothetical protein
MCMIRRQRPLPFVLSQPPKVGVGADLARARALDHEADVVAALEGVEVRGDQQLRRLSLDQPAHEQEARCLRGIQRIPLAVGVNCVVSTPLGTTATRSASMPPATYMR